MTRSSSGERPAGAGSAREAARAKRLATALKANLSRRKAQVRARASEPDAPGPDADPAATPHDSARIVDDKRSG
jgi:hypothetical protein